MNLLWFTPLVLPASLLAQTTGLAQPPLTIEDKLAYHVRHMVTPGAWVRAAIAAGEQTWREVPPEWKQGAAGYGQRYASSIGSNAVRNMLAFGIDSALHEDPRFYRLGHGSLWARTESALLQTVYCRNDRGRRTIAIWRIGSVYGTDLISNVWRPRSQDQIGDALIRGTVGLGIDTAFDVFREFWPDIRKRLRHK